MRAGPVRVLIVDDQAVFAEALRSFLSVDPRIEVVGVAAGGAEAVDQALLNDAEIVLMDIGMPGIDGIEATRRLLAIKPTTRVIVLTGRAADEAEREARAAGAADFLVKGGLHEQIRERVVEIAALARASVSESPPSASMQPQRSARSQLGTEIDGILSELRQLKNDLPWHEPAATEIAQNDATLGEAAD